MILCLSPVCHNSLSSKYAKSMWNQVLFQSHKNLKSHHPLRWDSQPQYNTVKMLARSLLLVKITLHQHLSTSRSTWDSDLWQSHVTNFNEYSQKGGNVYVFWVKAFAFLVSNYKRSQTHLERKASHSIFLEFSICFIDWWPHSWKI